MRSSLFPSARHYAFCYQHLQTLMSLDVDSSYKKHFQSNASDAQQISTVCLSFPLISTFMNLYSTFSHVSHSSLLLLELVTINVVFFFFFCFCFFLEHSQTSTWMSLNEVCFKLFISSCILLWIGAGESHVHLL